MAPLRQLAGFAALLLLASQAAAWERRFTKEEVIKAGAKWNDNEGRFAWWNETVDDFMAPEHKTRRSALGVWDSAPVTVTFYNSPGMDCTDGLGQCGFGSDTSGPALDGSGQPFLQTSLYPLHVASGNFDFLGGCGACGILSGPNNINIGYVVTDVTDPIDSLDRGGSSWPPYGSHIDTCLPQFQLYQPGTSGNNGGIFTGTWTRIDCNSIGSPDMPTNNVVIRFEAWNQWAKAVVISRLGGLGVVASVNFYTAADNNGGNSGDGSPVFHQGYKVQGWGAWWCPQADLSGLGGIGLQVTLEDGTVLTQSGYPMPDYSVWQTGQIFNFFQNVT